MRARVRVYGCVVCVPSCMHVLVYSQCMCIAECMYSRRSSHCNEVTGSHPFFKCTTCPCGSHRIAKCKPGDVVAADQHSHCSPVAVEPLDEDLALQQLILHLSV